MENEEMPLMQPDHAREYYLTNYIGQEFKEASESINDSFIQLDYFDVVEFYCEHRGMELNNPIFNQLNFYEAIESKANTMNKTDSYITIRPSNVPDNCNLRDLNKDYVLKDVSTTAMIKNITAIEERVVSGEISCNSCGEVYSDAKPNDRGMLLTPSKCKTCGGTHFTIHWDECTYEDIRTIKLEEPLESRTGGTTREFLGEIKGYQASPKYKLKPGDVCQVFGKVKTRATKSEENPNLELYLDIYSITPLNSNYEDMKITEYDEEEIKELSKNKDIFKMFCDSIAPNVYGYEDVKKGLVCQMFEGTRAEMLNGKDRHVIHILLLGEPGTGKSKLIEEVHDHSPKAIRSNGAGTSQAGITASAVRDERIGSWTMEAGGVVLADSGILTIDEFDKLSPSVMKALNEPMEQLSVSVAKAGLVQTMTARTSILAGANPKYGRYLEEKTFNQQVEIPVSTLSRFDLVYLIKDNIDKQNDLDLSMKIMQNLQPNNSNIIDDEMITKYVSYAKNRVFPMLTPSAMDNISKFYAEVRQEANEMNDGKVITLRELGAIIRLSCARAKCELRQEVTVQDTKEAIDIYAKSLETFGLDILHAGEIQHVFSDEELEWIEYTEDIIKKELQHNDGKIDNSTKKLIKADVKNQFSVSFDVAETVYDEAFSNVGETCEF